MHYSIRTKMMFTSRDGSTQPLPNQKFYTADYTNSVTKQKKIGVWSKFSQKWTDGVWW